MGGDMNPVGPRFRELNSWHWTVWAVVFVGLFMALSIVQERFAPSGRYSLDPRAGFAAYLAGWLACLACATWLQFTFTKFAAGTFPRVLGALLMFQAMYVVDLTYNASNEIRVARIEGLAARHCGSGGTESACRKLIQRSQHEIALLPADRQEALRQRAGNAGRNIELLTPDKKRLIESTYRELLAAQDQRDYGKMMEQARTILMYVDDYKDTRSYEVIAVRGLASQTPSPPPNR